MDQQPPTDPGPLPPISDYWPDAPHRTGPPAGFDDAPPPPGPAITLRTRAEPGRPRRRTGLVVTLVLLVVIAGAGYMLWDNGTLDLRMPAAGPAAPGLAPDPSPGLSSTGPGIDAPATTVTAPAGGRTGAAFELVSNAALVRLDVADLAGDLYRVTAPQGSSVTPRVVEADGTLRLFLDPTGRAGDEEVEVTLAGDVRWRLTLTGGVSKALLGLGAAKLDRLTLAGDAADLSVELPRPSGTLPVRMSGGIDQFTVTAGRDVPVRVRMRRGAGEVTFDGRRDEGVARDATFQNDAFAKGGNRIDLDATAGVGTLNVARG
ncbi:hypothetical protein [Actinoplanes sp. RD1]|uniref:hypothetical protein n=1 Tax=Actinoplanes sp. RD1 TaxID=3064538 RepID=UPI0027412046|nr:hypothetical protein [Actinoplanes sp. RD1]